MELPEKLFYFITLGIQSVRNLLNMAMPLTYILWPQKQTEVERTADGDIHIHTHTEISRPLSSSTSLSSILDDGGQPSVDIRNRKKKSFFTVSACF